MIGFAHQLELYPAPWLWFEVTCQDQRVRELADRHYPKRRKKGAKQYLAPGMRRAWLHIGTPRPKGSGLAGWGVVLNRFKGVWRWRNSLFRNESLTLSSELVEHATLLTYAAYGDMPARVGAPRLTTEVDIEETRARRGRISPPGHCYLMAGWEQIGERPRSHGRPALAYLGAPL